MAAKRARAARGPRNVFAAIFAKLRTGGRSDEARRRSGKMPLLARFAARGLRKGPDPVSLAMFAIDHVGAAAVRACASGVEVLIAAADQSPPPR
jgi:hypothetical protein